jgi:hypothetical protein
MQAGESHNISGLFESLGVLDTAAWAGDLPDKCQGLNTTW